MLIKWISFSSSFSSESSQMLHFLIATRGYLLFIYMASERAREIERSRETVKREKERERERERMSIGISF